MENHACLHRGELLVTACLPAWQEWASSQGPPLLAKDVAKLQLPHAVHVP